MDSLLLWFMILSSGSVLCATYFEKKYEDVLPITSISIIVILYLCGIIDKLEWGAVLICIASFGIYCFSGIGIMKKRNIHAFMQNMFTPAFCVFVVFFYMTVKLNLERRPSSWDEFSHWADIVKAMVTVDGLGTGTAARALFPSYPPAMPLFQYFLQKLYVWTSGNFFSEWRLYVAYQIFGFSLMMPFLKGLRWKRPLTIVISAVVIFMSPLMFVSGFYKYIYIDPFLGILSGCGLAMVYLNREKDIFYTLKVIGICMVLILAKDAGLLFAVLLAVAYSVDILFGYESNKARGGIWKKNGCSITIAGLAILLPKVSWSLHLKLTNARIAFSEPIIFGELIKVLTGEDTSYKTTVWKDFNKALGIRKVAIGNTGISFNYIVLSLILMLLLMGMVLLHNHKKLVVSSKKGSLLISIVFAQMLIYIMGLSITYMFKFTEYEAVQLASFARYMSIAYLAVWIVIIMLMLNYLQYGAKEYRIVGLCILVVVSMSIPMEYVVEHLQRTSVEASKEMREPYDKMCEVVEEYVQEGSRIYLISQATNGSDYYVLRYSIRPNTSNGKGWSIGVPFYEGDVWTTNLSAKEWQDILLHENTCGYDYVALYQINDYFVENYGILFENKDDIQMNSIFKVNKETGLLETCK